MNRSRVNIFKVIFSRKTLGLLIIMLQVLLIIRGLIGLNKYQTYVYGAFSVLTAVLLIYEINRDEEPAFQQVWIILIAIFPVFGAFVYLYIRFSYVNNKIQKRLNSIIEDTKPFLKQSSEIPAELSGIDSETTGIVNYLYRIGGYPTNKNTGIKYFPLGDDAYGEILNQLEKATKFIFLEFFIISEGYFWSSVLEILKRKAKQGVEIRIMYDGMGCMPHLDLDYPKLMQSYGMQCKIFAPIVPFFSTYQNNRDHRKIIVIDGQVAFTGGINISDEYINRYERFGHWKDAVIMLDGDGVRNFTMMFLQLWNLTEKQQDDFSRYNISKPNEQARGFVTPFADSPLDNEDVGRQVYLDLLNHAKDYVHVMSPYLMLDSEMMNAFKYAAKRGVDVKIILPHIPDKWYAFVIAHTYYPVLLEAGVKLYEYTPGFVHSKVLVSDDHKAFVGTINLDFRSLFLHYECGAYLYNVPEISAIEADVQNTLKHCHRYTMEDYKKWHWYLRLIGRVMRILAPLM